MIASYFFFSLEVVAEANFWRLSLKFWAHWKVYLSREVFGFPRYVIWSRLRSAGIILMLNEGCLSYGKDTDSWSSCKLVCGGWKLKFWSSGHSYWT